jgi:hypothetical protein
LASLGLSDTTDTTVSGTLQFTLAGAIPGGSTASGDLVVSQTPEPVSMALLGTGLLGLAFLLRKKTRAHKRSQKLR